MAPILKIESKEHPSKRDSPILVVPRRKMEFRGLLPQILRASQDGGKGLLQTFNLLAPIRDDWSGSLLRSFVDEITYQRQAFRICEVSW